MAAVKSITSSNREPSSNTKHGWIPLWYHGTGLSPFMCINITKWTQVT
jgi:hypothetical protein